MSTKHRKFKVLDVSHELDEESIKILRKVADVRIAPDFSSETIEREVKDVDGIILFSQGTIDRRVLENATNLKVVGRIGAGYQNVDIDACTKQGVAVVYSGAANSDTVADLTFGLILAVARNIAWANYAIRTTLDTKWDMSTGLKFMGTDVWGKTLGIIGFGKIGYRVAKRARGFDMKILVYDPYIEEEKVKKIGGEYVTLRTLLKESDFVTIHTPMTKETKGLIGEDEIKMMKDGAYLINAASGFGIIDEQALYRALVDGKLGGAGIDCPETKIGELTINPQKPLYKLNNVIALPMLGARTKECGPKMVRVVVEGVIKILKGEKPTCIVNPSVLMRE